MNSDGYAGNRHRQVFEEVFREKLRSGQQVNHLCQRPFCLQPGHLYAGDKQDNADDRGRTTAATSGSTCLTAIVSLRVPGRSRLGGRNARLPGYRRVSLQPPTATITRGRGLSGCDSFSVRFATCFWRMRNGRGRIHRFDHPSCGNPQMHIPWRLPAHSLASCVWRWRGNDWRPRCGTAVRLTDIGSRRSFLTALNRKTIEGQCGASGYTSMDPRVRFLTSPDQRRL